MAKFKLRSKFKAPPKRTATQAKNLIQVQRNDTQSPHLWNDLVQADTVLSFKSIDDAVDMVHRLGAAGGVLRYRAITVREEL